MTTTLGTDRRTERNDARYQNIKIASMESRTNALEHSVTLLTSRLDNMQLNLFVPSGTTKAQKVYVCNECDYETTSKDDHKKHTVKHNETEVPRIKNTQIDDSLSCKQCSYIAIHNRDLRRHELYMHTLDEEQVFYCNRCNYSTQHQDKLHDHVKNTHIKQRARTFYSRKGIYQRNSAEESKLKSSTSDQPIKCTFCDYRTTIIEDLRSHKRKHEVKSKPKFPFPAFSTVPTYINHEDEDKNNEEIHNCHKCGKKMQHGDEVKLHMEFYHAIKKQE